MHENVDITVIGGGIAGLWAAKSFCDDGLSVCLIERAQCLASGATIRNEGWLHAGTYAAASIDNREDAAAVVHSSKRGFDSILEFAPDCIDEQVTYALLGDESAAASRALQRWRENGIKHTEVSKQRLSDDGININNVAAAYRVEDLSINSHMLCSKLASYLKDHGGIIFTNTTFVKYDDSSLVITIDNEKRIKLTSQYFIVTAGNGTEDAIYTLTGNHVPMLYFKSHLKVFTRRTSHNYFFVDGGETGFMNHGNYSVAGLNRDSQLLLKPDYAPIVEKTRLLDGALVKLLGQRAPQIEGKHIACMKPTFQVNKGHPHLGEDILKISSNCYAALPGKMTQAPHMAATLRDIVLVDKLPMLRQETENTKPFAKYNLGSIVVSPRPLDTMAKQDGQKLF